MAPRILGRNVYLFVNSSQWLMPIALGELDDFRATSTTEMVRSRPIGYSLEAATLRYGGYQLQLKIGKNDPMLERWNHLVDRGLIGGSQPPEIFITEIIKHYDYAGRSIESLTNSSFIKPKVPIIENWIYKGVTLYAPEYAFSGQTEYEQSIDGFAAWKELGPIDTSFIKLEWLPQVGFQEIVYRTKDIGGGILQDIDASLNGFLNSKATGAKPGNPPGSINDPLINRP